VIYQGRTWRFTEGEFNADQNAIRSGTMTNGLLMAFNRFLFEMLHKAVAIGDAAYNSATTLNHATFRTKLYDESLKELKAIESVATKKFYKYQRDNESIIEGERVTYEKEEFVETYVAREQRKDKPTEEIYKKKIFDKNDIFEVFGATWYPNPDTKKPIANSGTSIVLRMLQYKTLANPSKNVSDFNDNWIANFLDFMYKTGWVDTRQVKDPLNFDPDIFKNSPIHPVLTATKNKYFKQITRVARALMDAKYLPSFEIKTKFNKLVEEEELKEHNENPREDYALSKPELDKLFYAKIDDSELALTRDQFIFQTMVGGLRINEFNDTNIVKKDDGYGSIYFAYETSKTKKRLKINNPTNHYLQEILKRHNDNIPFLTKGEIAKNVEMKYNTNLVKVAALLNLDRQIWGKKKVDKKWVEGFYPISELFSSLFARHTLIAILQRVKVIQEDRNYFVGHKPKKDTQSHYNPKLYTDHQYKLDIVNEKKIKPSRTIAF